jgi:hypothetical protein
MAATPTALSILTTSDDDLLGLSVGGRAYTVTHTGTLASAATVSFQMKTPAAVNPVLLFTDFGGDGETLKITFTENPTVTDGTTSMTPYNLNRASALTAASVWYSDPTSISAGTVLDTELTDAGHKMAGASAHDLTWVLKKSEDYIWTVENIGATTVTYVAKIIWAE